MIKKEWTVIGWNGDYFYFGNDRFIQCVYGYLLNKTIFNHSFGTKTYLKSISINARIVKVLRDRLQIIFVWCQDGKSRVNMSVA